MENVPQHVAIIMDGNRRWAKKRKLPTQFGHSEGANTLERIADDCEELGIKYLTVYAFSTENWKRSPEEVDYLMKLLAKHINDFDKRIKNRNIRFRLVGDINGLNKELQDGIRAIEERTKNKTGLTVNIAINYGGRAEMTFASRKIAEEVIKGNLKIENITEDTISEYLQTKDSPDPELIIRTGGEERLSGFLLWQSAYSELYFTDVLWPDFDRIELEKAIEEYNNRKRNFGK
ncbi:MAG: isoprenyl transferase [Clostridia bacterium]|nr:isoprenyl transferase [Clostridia bacterium]